MKGAPPGSLGRGIGTPRWSGSVVLDSQAPDEFPGRVSASRWRPSRISRWSERRIPRRRRWPASPALKPDVAVLDMRLPDRDGVSVYREIRSATPDMACLMLTSFSTPGCGYAAGQ